jgi:capsular polysaccharide biosynthesis protein
MGIPRISLVFFDPTIDVPRSDLLLIPTVLRTWHRVAPEFKAAVNFIQARIDAVLGTQHPSPYGERVFLSRSRGSFSRPLINRQKIESMARDAGFSIAYPETLSVAEQVALFRSAKHIIGEYGSALHGIIFARAGTICTALRSGSCGDPGFVHSGICDALDMQSGYVFGDVPRSDGSYAVSEADFSSYLSASNR